MRPTAFAAVLVVLVVLGAVSSPPALAVVPNPIVTNTSDSGWGSLRWAIENAQGHVGKDTITFSIQGAGVHVITPATDLPTITDQTAIDGYSQPGAVPATDTDPAELMIEIDASNTSRGLELNTDASSVRGLIVHSATGAFFDGDGIRLTGDGNYVAGNHIGTDGTNPLPNANYGVRVEGDANVVGGTTPADRNVISSNLVEVRVITGTANRIEGNWIGTDSTGDAVLVGGDGVVVDSSGNFVGSPYAGNVVAGETVGVALYGDENFVQGNLIGTNAAGDSALDNSVGVVVDGERNTIGGPNPGAGNLVSGNDLEGILLNSGGGNFTTVQGNLVGTSADGSQALPNGGFGDFPGIEVESSDNTIGGPEPGAGNVLSGNDGAGARILGDRNTLVGNKIGVDVTGLWDVGNGGSGVLIAGDYNAIGSTDPALAMNTIASNDGDGVFVESGTNNTILRNSFSQNDELGIDLGPDYVTVNDLAPDADAGANGLQNHPVITGAKKRRGVTTVAWTLDSLPSRWFRIEFYGTSCDPSGHGEGESFLGSALAETDGTGHDEGTTQIANAVGDQLVTMTATGIDAPFSRTLVNATSEFSRCEEVA